jgi:hypothetical protein
MAKPSQTEPQQSEDATCSILGRKRRCCVRQTQPQTCPWRKPSRRRDAPMPFWAQLTRDHVVPRSQCKRAFFPYVKEQLRSPITRPTTTPNQNAFMTQRTYQTSIVESNQKSLND